MKNFVSIVFIAALIAAGYGWVLNIVKLVAVAADPLTGLFVARVVGIFVAPLGAVLGYL